MFGSIDFSTNEFRGQMMMLGGMALLIWVMFRRNLRARQQNRKESQELAAHTKKIESRGPSGAPLANAPVEILRWQSSMFDLQRELKGELETKIAVVQSLVGLADERIATLNQLVARHGDTADMSSSNQAETGDAIPADDVVDGRDRPVNRN